MRSKTFAALIGASTATWTPYMECTFDTKDEADNTDAPVVTTNNLFKQIMQPGTPGTLEACQQLCDGYVRNAYKVGETHCCQWYYSGDPDTQNLCVQKSYVDADMDGYDIVVQRFAPKDGVEANAPHAIIYKGSEDQKATALVPVPTDHSAKDKMVKGKGKNTASDITWAAEVTGHRVTGKYNIVSPFTCQEWCTTQATADKDMAKKNGVCSFEYDNGRPGPSWKCKWETTETALSESLLPNAGVADSTTKIFHAAVYRGDATPLKEWADWKPPAEVKPDAKKTEDSALSIAASAASLITLAISY